MENPNEEKSARMTAYLMSIIDSVSNHCERKNHLKIPVDPLDILKITKGYGEVLVNILESK